VIEAIGNLFGWIMYGCYKVTHSYGVSILIFTLITKIILMPISVMVQKNSIKMVEMYPEMNRIKAKYFGSKDLISEEQYKLYKKKNYHPMLDLVPVFAQLIILMGVVDVIYRPISHLLHVSKDVINTLVTAFVTATGAEQTNSIQVQIVDFVRNGNDIKFLNDAVGTVITDSIATIDMRFCGINLGAVPITSGGIHILIPVIAAFSAWLMCFAQNKSNVLQSEQSKVNKWTTMTISVGLSLYLGFFVPAGVGVYWIFSNIIAIFTLYLLNACINPKKYIDYEALMESKLELDKVVKYQSAAKKQAKNDEFASKEKADYKRFMSYSNKQLVFYSEKNGFYKYFQNVIEYILEKTDITIHYITGDPNDSVFEMANDKFRVYYIGENKLIILMMKLECDVMVMTMPDLQKYHIKRSMVKPDIEYIYLDHGIGSDNLMLRKNALDYFDTIFASNDVGKAEMLAQEKTYGLKPRTIVEFGSCLIDNMIDAYEKGQLSNTIDDGPKKILIAPSWQEDNILDSCIDKLLAGLLGKGYEVIVRPHPQYVRHFEEKLTELNDRYKSYDDFELQTDFSSNTTVFEADVMITDWSSIAYEYSFCTLKPTLFIDTPMKVMNPDYEEIGVVPFDIEIRNKVGISVKMDELNTISEVMNQLLNAASYSKENMKAVRSQYLYNIGSSGMVGAKYIISQLIKYSKK